MPITSGIYLERNELVKPPCFLFLFPVMYLVHHKDIRPVNICIIVGQLQIKCKEREGNRLEHKHILQRNVNHLYCVRSLK